MIRTIDYLPSGIEHAQNVHQETRCNSILPLHQAVINGNAGEVEMLLRCKADPNEVCEATSISAIALAILQKDSQIVGCLFKYHRFPVELDEYRDNQLWYTLDLSRQGMEIGSVLHHAACCVCRDNGPSLLNDKGESMVKQLMDEGADPNEPLPPLHALSCQNSNVLSILPPCTSVDLIFDLLEGGCNPFIKTILFCHENPAFESDDEKFKLFKTFLRSWVHCECQKRCTNVSVNVGQLKLELLCNLSRKKLDRNLLATVLSSFLIKDDVLETDLHLVCFKAIQENISNGVCMAESMIRAFAREEYVRSTHEQLGNFLICKTESFLSQLRAPGSILCNQLPGGVLTQILRFMSSGELRQLLLVNKRGYSIWIHFTELRQKFSRRLFESEFRPFQARIAACGQ
mmetsp:Transcript_14176/g.32674  ORF Transcript_14176/g.32674 Transcript_14176/m.32674 type:complete len:402 (-) Transcript_14176:57-1262(-)